MKLIEKCIVLTYNILKGGMHMTTVSLRFDDDMKRELDEICDEMGMNLTTFFTIYAKKVLRDRKIPFEISAPVDPFYSESNIRMIKKQRSRSGKEKLLLSL